MKYKYAILLLTALFIVLIPEAAFAQPPPPPPLSVPIDGVSELLLIGGAAYVARKIWKKRKDGKEEDL